MALREKGYEPHPNNGIWYLGIAPKNEEDEEEVPNPFRGRAS